MPAKRKKVNMAAVAQLAGCSLEAINKILNNGGTRYSIELIVKVYKAAGQLCYEHPGLAAIEPIVAEYYEGKTKPKRVQPSFHRIAVRGGTAENVVRNVLGTLYHPVSVAMVRKVIRAAKAEGYIFDDATKKRLLEFIRNKEGKNKTE